MLKQWIFLFLLTCKLFGSSSNPYIYITNIETNSSWRSEETMIELSSGTKWVVLDTSESNFSNWSVGNHVFFWLKEEDNYEEFFMFNMDEFGFITVTYENLNAFWRS